MQNYNYSSKFEELLSKERCRRSYYRLIGFNPRSILEIGYGNSPIIKYFKEDEFDKYVGVDIDRNNKFLDSKKIVLYDGRFEDNIDKFTDDYDAIVINSVLHTVENMEYFLDLLNIISNYTTVLYITVPNSNSMHRILGCNMNIIRDTTDFSSLDLENKHSIVFDKKSLHNLLNNNGFRILYTNTYCIKPFSGKQMDRIITKDMFDGLLRLSDSYKFNGLGCEIEVIIDKEI